MISRRLGANAGPVLVVDPIGAVILAATEAAAFRLGIPAAGFPAQLDAASPVVHQLRDTGGGLEFGQSSQATLIFWTSRGVEPIASTIERVQGGSGLLLVSLGSEATETNSAIPNPARPPRDDALTLAEIARRIRAGRATDAATLPNSAKSEPGTTSQPPPNGVNSQSADAGQSLTVTRGALSKIAHELKTPLSAIAAAAEIMKDERLGTFGNDRYRGYAADIYESARHALGVLDRMMGRASQSGDREPPLEFRQIDANAAVESAVSVMRPIADNAGVNLSSSSERALPHIVADETTLRQMLFNLISNAVKFTPAGGAVQVGTWSVLDGPVTIEVRDNGPGMTASEIAAALDHDQPIEPRPRPKGGLGLGLPLVRTLAEANGASIQIDSTPRKGTSVRLLFPKTRVVPV